MEGNTSKQGAEGGHGAVWETLKTMDYLFVKFKQAAEETQFDELSHFKSGIDCGWAKLEEYYVKTDCTPIYRAALALTHLTDSTTLSGTGKPRWIGHNGTVTCSLLQVACLMNMFDRPKLKTKPKRNS